MLLMPRLFRNALIGRYDLHIVLQEHGAGLARQHTLECRSGQAFSGSEQLMDLSTGVTGLRPSVFLLIGKNNKYSAYTYSA